MRYTVLAAAVLFVSITLSPAQDPEIESLLKRLPPPETLVKKEIAPGIHRNDPVLQDPLCSKINEAVATKNSSRALRLARELSARHPKSPLGHFLRGSFALTMRQFTEASAAFRQAVALEPRFAFAQLGLGVAEMAQSRFAAALPHLRRSTELEPKLSIGWVVQSACCMRLGLKEESVRAARQATVLAPKAVIAWRQLAYAENAAGHRAEGSAAAAKASKLSPYLDPRIPPPSEALPAARRAAQAQPNNAVAQYHLGSTLVAAGRLEEGAVIMRKAVSLDQKHGGWWQNLGIVYEKLGRQREADAAFARAEKLMPVLADLNKQTVAARRKKSERR
jgi:superkiller protein 3